MSAVEFVTMPPTICAAAVSAHRMIASHSLRAAPRRRSIAARRCPDMPAASSALKETS